MSKLIKSWRKIAGKAFRIGVGFSFTAVALLHVLGFAPSEVVKRALISHLRCTASGRGTAAELDPRIVIVDIDEQSLSEVGRWPWSRDVVAKLIVELTDRLGAASVGFDIVFAEPQQSDALLALDSIIKKKPALDTPLEELRTGIQAQFDRDAQLAEVLADRPVVLGYYMNQDPTALSGALPPALIKKSQLGELTLDSTSWQGYGGNIPVLQKNAEGGYFNPIVDEDGTVRSIPLLAQFNDAYYQSFALGTLRRALGNPQVIPVFPEGVPDDYGAVELIALRSPDVRVGHSR